MNLDSYHSCFGVLSNRLRMRIIEEVSKKHMTVSELVKKTGVEQSRLSHSLGALKKCGYIDFEKKGKERIYFLNKSLGKKIKSCVKKGKMVEALVSHFCNRVEKKCNC